MWGRYTISAFYIISILLSFHRDTFSGPAKDDDQRLEERGHTHINLQWSISFYLILLTADHLAFL